MVDHREITGPSPEVENSVEGERALMEALLKSSHLFKSLDEGGRQRLLDISHIIRFNKDDVIIREGDVGEAFFVIRHGQVKVTCSQDEGPDLVLAAQLGSGAVLGEVALLTGQKRMATVTALEPVEAMAFPKPNISAILEDYPKVYKLLQALSTSRTRDTLQKTLGS